MTLRCPSCNLNQFATRSGNCRRCRKSLGIDPIPSIPTPPPPPVYTPVVNRYRTPDRPLRIRIAMALRACLEIQGLTQYSLGEKMGCPRTLISKWVNAHTTPTLESICHISAGLGISPYLFMMAVEEVGKEA